MATTNPVLRVRSADEARALLTELQKEEVCTGGAWRTCVQSQTVWCALIRVAPTRDY